MKYTNNHNLPLSLAVWLATDNYDHNNDPYTFSATELLKPMRSIILSRQHPELAKRSIDVMSVLASRIGTAIHDSIESSWVSEKVKDTLISLGIKKSIADRIIVNPTKEYLADNPKSIPVYFEVRSEKKIGKFTISGKFDCVMNGVVEDFKSTGTYTYAKQTSVDKHKEQGSIYRFLKPDLINKDHVNIDFIFLDWSKLSAMKDKNYPQTKIITQKINLMSLEETEKFIKDKLDTIASLLEVSQENLPMCTDEELWKQPATYKFYKDPNKTTRSTKNFTDLQEAELFQEQKHNGQGIIKAIQSKAKKCNYCDVAEICEQAISLKKQDLL